MQTTHAYPGTPQHQALLHQLVTYYRDDPRVRAVCLFGSLARGTWDQYSDLDLDVVLRDDVQIDVVEEVRVVCATFAPIGEQPILLTSPRADAVDVVLASLRELSLRYHPLATTSPNIVDSLQLLTGELSLAQVRAAGRANALPRRGSVRLLLDQFVRSALAVDRELQRGHVWTALGVLDGMRTVVLELFTQAHGGGRPHSVFQVQAPRVLQEQLGRTLPQASAVSLQRALLRLCALVEAQHGQLGCTDELADAHRTILAGIRQRQQRLHGDETSDEAGSAEARRANDPSA